jgi:hypothetical protein
MYLQCLNNFRNQIPTSQQQKTTYQRTRMSENNFAGTAATFTGTQCFRLLFARVLKPAVLSVSVENEETLSQHVSDACQAIRNCPGTFETVRQPLTRSVYVCVGRGGVHFEGLF